MADPRVPSPQYICSGEGADGDHCCYLGGKRCVHLRENVGGRRYACGLVLEYGSFGVAVKTLEYLHVGEHWVSRGLPFNYCQTFDPAFCCQPEFRGDRRNDNLGRDNLPGTVLDIRGVSDGNMG